MKGRTLRCCDPCNHGLAVALDRRIHEFVVDVEPRVDQTVRAEKMNSEIPTSEEDYIGSTPWTSPLHSGSARERAADR